MRPVLSALLGLLLLPLAAADHEGFLLTAARLDSVFEPAEAVGSRWDLTFTVRNEGPARPAWLAIHEAPVVFDLMYTQWHERPMMAAGETGTFVVRIDWSLPETIGIPVPDWLCLQVGGDEWPPNRCWSVLPGPALPNGAYPEDIPHWQLGDTPMGDME